MLVENIVNQNTNPIPPFSENVQTTTPPSQQVFQPSKPKPKFSLATIIGIILFLLVAGSAAGYFAFRPQIERLVSKPTPSVTPGLTINPSPTPTPDPTANWRTYQGNGFSFKYPPNASAEQITGKSIINVFPEQAEEYRSSTDPKQYEKLYNLQIAIEENPDGLTAREVAEKKIKDAEAKNDKTLNSTIKNARGTLKNYSFAGLQGVSMEFYHTEPFETIFVADNSKVYVIKMVGDEDKPLSAAQKIIAQILSTFKFTD